MNISNQTGDGAIIKMTSEKLEIYQVTTKSPMYSNVTTFNNETSFDRIEDLAKIEIAVQGAIIALAIFGNMCVLIALLRRKKKASRMHIFIMHLCIADLLVAVFNILPQLIWDITYRWQAGDFLCRFIKYMQIFVLYLSTYILVMTAFDRYRAICHPLSNHTWTPRLVHLMIGVAYTMSALFSIPQFIMFKVQEIQPGSGVTDCWVHFYPNWTLQLYIALFTVTIYVLPFLILLLCYSSICYTVWRKYKLSKDSGSYVARDYMSRDSLKAQHVVVSNDKGTSTKNIIPRNHSFRGFSKAKMKTVKLTFVIILAYLICWSPFFISQLWWLIDESAPTSHGAMVIMLLLASLNSCCNPWIYLAFGGNLVQYLNPCEWVKSKQTLQNSTNCVSTCCARNKQKSVKRKWTFRRTDSSGYNSYYSVNSTRLASLPEVTEQTIINNCSSPRMCAENIQLKPLANNMIAYGCLDRSEDNHDFKLD